MRESHLLRAVATIGAAILVLPACTTGDLTVQPSSAEPTAFPSPSLTAAASPTESPVTPPAVDACAGLPALSPRTDETDRISGYSIQLLRDTGPREFATGTTTLNDEGAPAAYLVASGDTVFSIASRFCSFSMYLEWINSVRRNGFFAGTDTQFSIYAGDTLNLDAYTVTSVGDENGVIYSNTPIIYLPPQR